MNQPQLLPFRMGTRQRLKRVGSQAFSVGQTLEFELPRVGMLQGIFIRANLSGFGAATGTANARAPWSCVNRFTLSTNQGAASIIDVSGYGAMLQQRLFNFASNYANDSTLYTAPVADMDPALPIRASWYLPVSMNNGEEFDMGMINLQAPEIQVRLSVRCGVLTDIAAAIESLTGTIEVYYVFYEIPDPSQFALPRLVVVRSLEENQPINATGENLYTIPRQGTLLQMIQTVELNGAFSDAWDDIRLRFNKSDEPYTIPQWAQRLTERNKYGVEHVTGAIFWDFYSAYDRVNTGDLRDAIDTEELSTSEFIVNITAGSTLGSNNNTLRTIRRFLQVME